jgi:hypothetical protein
MINNIEISPSPTGKISEKTLNPKKDQPTNSLIRDIVNYKKTIDATIEPKKESSINVAEQLFLDVIKNQANLRDRLTQDDVKKELNADLIERMVLPELDKLQDKNAITKENASEYLDLLKIKLAKEDQANEDRLDELNQKSGNGLRNITLSVSSSFIAGDIYYNKIFDCLLRQAAKEKIEQLNSSFNNGMTPEEQKKFKEMTQNIIDHPSNWGEESLDLNKVRLEYFDDLYGLERWPIVKKFAQSSGLIPEEIFDRTEKNIIQRLFNEKLFPGGHQSDDGDIAAAKIGDLGNTYALPLMLQHLETHGSGHTSAIVLEQMQRLLRESNPTTLNKTLETIPKNKRLLLEALGNENSYLRRFNENDAICYELKDEDLAITREQLAIILKKNNLLDGKQLRNFYYSYGEDNQKDLELIIKSKSDIEKGIIDSKLNVWIKPADKLLAALVNPDNGESSAFPKKIIKEGIGISDEKLLTTIDHIFNEKTFKESNFDREAFLDGLILLNSKDDGKNVLKTILSAYKGAREDPKRIRRIFQSLLTLDSFGVYEPATQNTDLQNTNDLKNIEELMKRTVVEATCNRLGLPPEYQEKIENNLEEFLKNGVFEIIPTLAGNYERKKEPEVNNLLKAITTHIFKGDFREWRYSHEKSEAQLAGLSPEEKEFWKKNLDPITVDIALSEDENKKRIDNDIKNLTAYESDDAPTLFKIGVEPVETCKSWRNGEENECLPADVADSNKKVLNVANNQNKIVERSIIKLTNQREENDPESKTKRNTLFVEKPYATLDSKEMHQAFIRLLLKKAQSLNSSITLVRNTNKAGKKENGFDEKAIKLFEEEARSSGFTLSEGKLEIFIPPSLNKYDYSDVLGGKIENFGVYKNLETISFEKTKTPPILSSLT